MDDMEEKTFIPFRFVEGTALSLQLRHRKSMDIVKIINKFSR